MSEGKVIALCNQKGGVGKTTTCANLGIGLSRQEKRVLLIDSDPQASLTLSLGYKHPDEIPVTLATIMQNIIDERPIPAGHGILHHAEGVDLLPANIALSGIDVLLINTMSREGILKTYIDEIRSRYDYILIDCMPSLGMMTINAMAASSSIIIPAQPHYLSAMGLEMLLRSASKVKRQINPALKIDGILMTMVDNRTNFTRDIISLLRGQYEEKIRVFATEIPHSVKAVETSAEGRSIYLHDRNGKVALAYQKLTEEVIGLEKQCFKNRADSVR
ncbi:MAG: ParA family protein [Saccharofermentanales bacterium]